MFSLFFIGNFVEKIIGRKRFFWFYFLSGIIAGLFFTFSSLFSSSFLKDIFGSIYISGLGASGAIFGLLGLLAVLTPKARVFLIAGPLIAIILEALIGNIFSSSLASALVIIVNIYFIISIFAIFSFGALRKISLPVEMPFWILPVIAIVPLIILDLFIDLPIGNTAHLGGLLSGLAYGFYLRHKYKKKVMMLNKMFG